MATTANSAASRKPSGSSTHSVGHSPSGSPLPLTHGSLNPASANNVFSSMSPSMGLKSWQVWTNTSSPSSTPVSKRTPSMSSGTSPSDASQHAPSGPWKSSTTAWDVSASAGGVKDWDLDGSPRKKDDNLSSTNPLSFQHARQRQAAAAQAAAFPTHKQRDDPAARRVVSESQARLGLDADDNVKLTAASPYTPLTNLMPLPAPLGGPYDPSRQGIDAAALGLRNLNLDDHSYDTAQLNGVKGQSPQATEAHRIPPHAAYYPQYYNGSVAPEPYLDYSTNYNGSSEPSVYTPNGPNANGASPYISHRAYGPANGVYYPEYNNVGAPGAQYYYPQPMIYHPSSPMPSPMPAPAVPAAGDKKQTIPPYPYQSQQPPMGQGLMMPGMRHGTPTPHSQYPEYGSVPALIPGTPIYRPSGRVLHPGYQAQAHQNGRQRRHAHSGEHHVVRSALLEEYRLNKAKKWELKDILGSVVEFSSDQHGSRFIQQKLDGASAEDKQAVFDEVVPDHALQLIMSVFGNYVVQKLFEHGTTTQRTLLAQTMEGHILGLSLHTYGCRVVQKAIEYISPEQQSALVKELDGHILKCVKDANGNHVIQKLIERMPAERLPFVSAFRGSVYELSTHSYGCRVLQRCFEYLPDTHTRPLLNELLKYTAALMQDQFGNYVVQFVLEHGSTTDRAGIVSQLKGQMLHMAQHKFASNVVEKALLTANLEDRRALIDEIMTLKPDGTSPILIMMKDQFANYVLQRALVVVDEHQREPFINCIRPQLAAMSRYASVYSKHLISIQRLIAEKSTVVPEAPTQTIPAVTITA